MLKKALIIGIALCLFMSITACSQQGSSSISQEESPSIEAEDVPNSLAYSSSLVSNESTNNVSGNPTVDGKEDDDNSILTIDESTNSVSGNPTVDGREDDDNSSPTIDESTSSVSGNPTVDGREDEDYSVSAIDESDKEKIMLEIQSVIKSYKDGTISNKGTTVSSFDPAPSDVRFPVISRVDDFNIEVTGIGSDVVVSLDAGTYLMHIDLHIDNFIWTAYSSTFQLK